MYSVNSKEYWDDRFASGEWDACGGGEQSLFFAKVAHSNMPDFLRQDLGKNSWSVVDIGCAQGEGTAYLARQFPLCRFIGVDHSSKDIAEAQEQYGNCDFFVSDSYEEVVSADVVFSSNALEYLRAPKQLIEKMCAAAGKYVILLLPFEASLNIDEHIVKLTLENFPIRMRGFYLESYSIADCSSIKGTMWHGEQILLVYTNSEYRPEQITLQDVHDHFCGKKDQRILQFERQVHDLESQIQELNVQLRTSKTKISDALVCLYAMVGSIFFKIVHFIYRFFKQGFHKEKTERKKFRKWLWGRIHHVPDPDHKYNPLFSVISILERAEHVEALPNLKVLEQEYTKQDVIILSVIDYDFRHQRPQHFAQRLAARGHRVYYVNAGFERTCMERLQEENLWQVTLLGEEHTTIHLTDWADDLEEVAHQLEQLLYRHGIRDAVLVVDYPNWLHVALHLRKKYGFRIITDYMDDFTGFLNPTEALVRKNCERLLTESDGVIASSQFLYEIAIKYNLCVTIDRNGTEYSYFHRAAEKTVSNERPVIGYYGAIAEWFNVDAVCRCAKRFPQCDIVLVGAVTAHRRRLEKYRNIQLVGEVPYSELLPYLERFDVCLIPFDTSTDLIKATNPVKFYEYLSAGKKVVATEIPELMPYRDRYVYMENDPEKFCDAVERCLKGTDTLADAEDRFQFAKENDWDARTLVFEAALKAVYPKISIVVLCYNQLEYTCQCVESILDVTAYPNYELILVDNCSSDGTAAYLQKMEKQDSRIKIVLNKTNRGFAGGNNDGIAVSDGEYIVLLNNDTLVSRGWLTGMVKHFDADDSVGLVGPVTNSIGNEARIVVQYQDVEDMPRFAYEYTFSHMGEEYPHHGVLAMFCLMISRRLYDQVGPLDEEYGIGMFEDDDYSAASKKAGFRNVMAEDVFIHHFGSVSFKKLEDDTYMALFRKNQKYFEGKWKTKWSQHQYRPGVS